IGFAIPINLARSVMEQLIKTGKVRRGWLGVSIGDVYEEVAESKGLDRPTGAFVHSVVKGSPAQKAGIKVEDIILKVNDIEITSRDHLTASVASIAPETEVKVTLWRDGKTKVITVKLGERPEEDTIEAVDEAEKSVKLGVEVQDLNSDLAQRLNLDDDAEGVVIVSVEANSVAERKGLQRGDVIQEVNDQVVTNVREFKDAIKKAEAGSVLRLRLLRDNRGFSVYLRLPKN
ncbi:PDZ domain-containing protein, partial [candidate division KSB1 bacterium]|nr:PDZ domain-containing protein [candidate division KSB1 bacterium]